VQVHNVGRPRVPSEGYGLPGRHVVVDGHAIWRRNTRKFREKLARLTESIRRTFDG
jgi:hypothetical protein